MSIKKLVSYLTFLSIFMHLFCCVLPAIMGIFWVGATFGLTSLELFKFSFFEKHENAFLIVSGAMLFITGIIYWISYKIDCRTDGNCKHGSCKKVKSRSLYFFCFSVFMYLIVLIVHSFHS